MSIQLFSKIFAIIIFLASYLVLSYGYKDAMKQCQTEHSFAVCQHTLG